METPSSSTRRITRSQTLAAALNNNNIPTSRDSEKGVSKSKQRATKQQQDHSALIDITNDSPIIGLATGELLKTPSSAVSKKRAIGAKNTPGSGETLLRCQVKTLLQRVEEEADLSKISLPQLLNPSEDASVATDNGLASINASPVIQEQTISQVASDSFDGETLESKDSGMNLISRSLLLDFTEKTESTECSSLVNDDSVDEDEDGSSVWSIQVNARSVSGEDDEEPVAEVDESYNANSEDNEGIEYNIGELIEELREEMSKIDVNNNETRMAKFTGRHTRFLYNSDDENVEEHASGGVSPNVLCLKGRPTPKGKHIRFDI